MGLTEYRKKAGLSDWRKRQRRERVWDYILGHTGTDAFRLKQGLGDFVPPSVIESLLREWAREGYMIVEKPSRKPKRYHVQPEFRPLAIRGIK